MKRGLWVTLVTLLVTFAALEVYCRFREGKAATKKQGKRYLVQGTTMRDEPVGEPGGAIALRHDPFVGYMTAPGQSVGYATTNALGFRGPEWTRKSRAQRRVIVLGGSLVFGQGASGDDRVLSARLEARLRDAGRDVEVLNAGVIGHSATQELILLTTKLLDYQPDVIVVVDGWNDFYFAGVLPEGVDRLVPPTFLEFDELLGRTRESGLNILRASAAVRWVERRLDVRRRRAAPRTFVGYSDNADAAVATYRTMIERVILVARAAGVRTVIAPQPEIMHRGGEIPAAEQALRVDAEPSGYAALSKATYRRFVDAACAVATAERIGFVDLTGIFDDVAETVFVDQVHLNDRGCDLLAASLVPAIDPLLREPQLSPGETTR